MPSVLMKTETRGVSIVLLLSQTESNLWLCVYVCGRREMFTSLVLVIGIFSTPIPHGLRGQNQRLILSVGGAFDKI